MHCKKCFANSPLQVEDFAPQISRSETACNELVEFAIEAQFATCFLLCSLCRFWEGQHSSRTLDEFVLTNQILDLCYIVNTIFSMLIFNGLIRRQVESLFRNPQSSWHRVDQRHCYFLKKAILSPGCWPLQWNSIFRIWFR